MERLQTVPSHPLQQPMNLCGTPFKRSPTKSASKKEMLLTKLVEGFHANPIGLGGTGGNMPTTGGHSFVLQFFKGHTPRTGPPVEIPGLGDAPRTVPATHLPAAPVGEQVGGGGWGWSGVGVGLGCWRGGVGVGLAKLGTPRTPTIF